MHGWTQCAADSYLELYGTPVLLHRQRDFISFFQTQTICKAIRNWRAFLFQPQSNENRFHQFRLDVITEISFTRFRFVPFAFFCLFCLSPSFLDTDGQRYLFWLYPSYCISILCILICVHILVKWAYFFWIFQEHEHRCLLQMRQCTRQQYKHVNSTKLQATANLSLKSHQNPSVWPRCRCTVTDVTN